MLKYQIILDHENCLKLIKHDFLKIYDWKSINLRDCPKAKGCIVSLDFTNAEAAVSVMGYLLMLCDQHSMDIPIRRLF